MFQINWKLKALLYKIFYLFKLKKTLFFIQKKITKRSDVKIEEITFYWKHHLKYLQSFESVKILEFGAGKSLEQNIFLSYQSKLKFDQTLIDISNMLDIDLFNKANEQIANLLNLKKEPFVKSIEEIEKFYNIKYLAPFTLEEIEKKGFSFNACISSTTFEHLPLNVLNNVFNTLKKIIKKDGIISTFIDYSDHYSHTDKNINNLNFLQFSESEWRKYNTPLLYQNRLRHQNFKEFFLKSGCKIVDEIKGNTGITPNKISINFDPKHKETLLLWGHFVLKFV